MSASRRSLLSVLPELRILGGLASERATEKLWTCSCQCAFPRGSQFRASRLDDEIESQVACLQEVIDLGRIVREKKDFDENAAVKEVIIVSRDQKKLSACKKLEKYLYQELNVMKVSTTDEESKWCTFSARTDGKFWANALAKLGKVRNYVDGQNTSTRKASQSYRKQIVEFEKSKLRRRFWNMKRMDKWKSRARLSLQGNLSS